jgi:hypothetical protein
MVVFMTEEMSMAVTLRGLLGRLYPELQEGEGFFIQSFNGKSDLEKNIPRRMRNWNYGEPTFVILRDADGGDCLTTKKHLVQLAKTSGKPFKIRIVCQQLESWFLGDGEAVQAAFPRTKISNETRKYREPDRLTNASDELGRVTGDFSKVARARLIVPHLIEGRNRSGSFRVFYRTLVDCFEG